MIRFQRTLVAALGLTLLAVVVSLVARTGYGQNGNATGQLQSVRAFDAPRVAYDSRLQCRSRMARTRPAVTSIPSRLASSWWSPSRQALLI